MSAWQPSAFLPSSSLLLHAVVSYFWSSMWFPVFPLGSSLLACLWLTFSITALHINQLILNPVLEFQNARRSWLCVRGLIYLQPVCLDKRQRNDVIFLRRLDTLHWKREADGLRSSTWVPYVTLAGSGDVPQVYCHDQCHGFQFFSCPCFCSSSERGLPWELSSQGACPVLVLAPVRLVTVPEPCWCGVSCGEQKGSRTLWLILKLLVAVPLRCDLYVDIKFPSREALLHKTLLCLCLLLICLIRAYFRCSIMEPVEEREDVPFTPTMVMKLWSSLRLEAVGTSCSHCSPHPAFCCS
jgi:hypothetical protein